MSIEIEAKIYIHDVAKLQAQLAAAGAIIVKPRVFEHNIRYDTADRSISGYGGVLRLRQDEIVRLTYKGRGSASPEGFIERVEVETTVGDLDTMDSILRLLGYKPFMVYQKYRTTYEIPGIPDVELVLDELPYGVFIEIEGKPAAIEASLERLEMTTANRITASYIQIFETVRREHNLSIVNLTFEDFAGITLDPTVFERC